jgi:hypothetical protein
MDQNVAAYLVFVWLAANSDVSDWGWSVVDRKTIEN